MQHGAGKCGHSLLGSFIGFRIEGHPLIVVRFCSLRSQGCQGCAGLTRDLGLGTCKAIVGTLLGEGV